MNKSVLGAVAVAAAVIGSTYAFFGPDGGDAREGQPANGTAVTGRGSAAVMAGGAAASATGVAAGAGVVPADATRHAPAVPTRSAWTPRTHAAAGDLARLATLPAGDAALALAHKLESEADAETVPAFVEALRTAADPGVERTAITVLARTAGAEAVTALADGYGSMAPEHRGRVLQVLESLQNPAALPGLEQIVAADTSEKRSPLVMSALAGAANLGTMESVDYLIAQVGTPGNQDLALLALERVHTAQGSEMIRAASQGSRTAEHLLPGLREALARIAQAGSNAK